MMSTSEQIYPEPPAAEETSEAFWGAVAGLLWLLFLVALAVAPAVVIAAWRWLL